MGKKRIFEIAKELGVKTTEITELLAKHNICLLYTSDAADEL